MERAVGVMKGCLVLGPKFRLVGPQKVDKFRKEVVRVVRDISKVGGEFAPLVI